MSTLTLKGLTSGSSVLKAPDSGSNEVTFTMPASTGTLLTTDGDGSSLTGVGVDGISSSANATAITIDSSENVGIGTTSPQKNLHIFKTEGSVGAKHATIRLGGYSTVGPDISAYRVTGDSNDQGLIFSTYHNTNGTVDTLTLDSSGNVGIGVASPSAKIDIADSSIVALLGSSSGTTRADATSKVARAGVVHYTNAEEPVGFLYGQSTASKNQIAIGGGTSQFNAATEISFWTAADQTTTTGTNRMRIDSSGNVGIGVIPEAWHNDYRNLAVGGTGVLWSQTAVSTGKAMGIGQNFYYDGSNKYITTDEASRFYQYNGTHNFEVASSGSADAAISWTTAMTIDNDGIITKPLHPIFDVYFNSSGGTGYGGTIIHPDTMVDIGGNHSTSTGRFTAPVAGTYYFYSTFIKNSSTGVGRRYIRLNGANVANGRHLRLDDPDEGKYGDNGTVAITMTLSVNDYVTAWQDNADTHGGGYDYFGGYLIG